MNLKAAFVQKTLLRSVKRVVTLADLTLEKDIEKSCTDFLELDGWRSFKMEQNFSERKRKSVGEPGMADRLYIRYCGKPLVKQSWDFGLAPAERMAEVMFVEWKRLKGGSGKRALFTKAEKAKIRQLRWIAEERAKGALVLLAGVDFPATIEGFRGWYRSSGLMRRAA